MSRVLQLVTRDEPGGVRVLTTMVADGLTRRGHTVTTLPLRGQPGALRRVAREIRRGRYDAILSYQVAAGLFGHVLGRAAGIPLRAAHLTALPSAMRPAWRWLDRLWGVWGLHTTVIANSSATLAAMAPYPPAYRRRLALIRHGVMPLPDPDTGHRPWRQALGIAPTAPMLVSSGRLMAQKNQAIAVAALPALPAAHLVVAGDGPLRDALLHQARALGVADRLHLVGDLDPVALAGLLSEGDIYVFPSTWESFGLAAAEAAMAGLPIVASDLPVLREVLAPALARFTAPNDAAALAETIAATLADYPSPGARRAAAAAMRAFHGMEAMIDAYCGLLNRIN